MIPEIKPEVEYHDFLFDRGEISFDELIYIKGAKTPPETGRRTRQVLSKHGKKHEYLSIVYRRLVFGGCKEVYG